MIISILNQKGGVGKTTLSVNIARGFKLKGYKTLLVDSDSQGSALRWHERSNEQERGDLLDLTCLPGSTLDKDVKKFACHYDMVIIDGVPSISPVTACAIKAADLILIPVTPSPYDIWATEDLVRTVQDRIIMTDGKTKAAFIISRKINRTIIGKEIYEDLKKLELPVFFNGTTQRISYATSAQEGLTVFDDKYANNIESLEIIAIMKEIEEFYHGTN